MKAKRVILMLTVVSLIVAIPVFALPAPTGLLVNVGVDAVECDWDDVIGAAKYSVDIEGDVTIDGVIGTVPVEVSFGTSDRAEGDMADSDLDIPIDDLAAAIAAELGVAVEDLISLDDAYAKVKALNPGKGNGKQKNPFSDLAGPFSVDFDD